MSQEEELDLGLVQKVFGANYEQNPAYHAFMAQLPDRGTHNLNLDLGDRVTGAQDYYSTHRIVLRRERSGW